MNITFLRPLVGLCVVVCCAVPLAWGQGKPSPKPAPKPPPAVMVTKTDGTTVRGTLVAAGPGTITVAPPPAAGKAPQGEPVVIPWRVVAKLSNGLTQAKALEQFKAEHGSEVCDTCHGKTTVACATCKGTGHDPASGTDCKTCHGELLVACKAPKCKDGKIPCPQPCLKLSEGTWITKDGLRIRTYPTKGGWNGISERHLGQIVYYDKSGTLINNGVCPTCGGKTIVDCPTCDGTAKAPCPTCTTRKEAAACPSHCEKGRVDCTACGATGVKGGAGTTSPPAPAGQAPPPAPAGDAPPPTAPQPPPPPVPEPPKGSEPLPF